MVNMMTPTALRCACCLMIKPKRRIKTSPGQAANRLLADKEIREGFQPYQKEVLVSRSDMVFSFLIFLTHYRSK